MANLSPHRLRKVVETLEDSAIGASAFGLESPDSGHVLFRCWSKDNPIWQFNLSDPPPQNGHTPAFALEFCPGEFRETERLSFSQGGREARWEEALKNLARWAERIEVELTNSTLYGRQVEALKRAFLQRLDALESDAEFSFDEIRELRAQMNSMAEEIERLKTDLNLAEEDIQSVKETVQSLELQITKMSKKTWLRTAGTKLLSVFGKFAASESGQKLLGRVADKLLPPTS